MLRDYKKAVIFDYREKNTEGLLSSNLSDPTPGKLRDEALLLLNSRPQKKDEKIIKDFFNLGVVSEDYSPSIRRFDVDKLRPLVKFLKCQIEDTGDRNIELLAWLIDFEPRPYDSKIDYTIKKSGGKPRAGNPKSGKKGPEKLFLFSLVKIRQVIKSSIKPRPKYAIGITILLAFFGGGTFLSMSNAEYERNTKVYICTSRVAKKYHLDSTCHGLKNCKSEIIQTTIAEAKKANKTLCEIEN